MIESESIVDGRNLLENLPFDLTCAKNTSNFLAGPAFMQELDASAHGADHSYFEAVRG